MVTQTVSIHDVRRTVVKYFPTLWQAMEACLSASATLKLLQLDIPTGLILVGYPSSGKTTLLNMFLGEHGYKYHTDKFNPQAWVSHYAGVSKEQLEDIDMLPKIRDKILVTPELAPIFRGREDVLTANFSTITRVMDGHGYTSNSGVHGGRGYTGEYLFTWLGATTPFPKRTWELMAQLGSRLFFFDMPSGVADKEELEAIVYGENNYKARVQECQDVVTDFLVALFKDGIRNVKFDATKTPPEAKDRFLLLGNLVAKGRAAVEAGTTGHFEAGSTSQALTEMPHRAITVLCNISWGHAILSGRNYPTLEDTDVAVRIAFSSMPHNRSQCLRAIVKIGNNAKVRDVANRSMLAVETVRRCLRELEALGFGRLVDDPLDTGKGDNPTQRFLLSQEFGWLNLPGLRGILT